MNLSKGPYENHYYALGEPIRNIVKQGQELLCAVRAGAFYQDLLSARDYYDSLYASWTHINNPENGETLWAINKSRGNTAYPQSLGELCIEIAEEKLLAYKVHGKMTDLIKEHIERVGVFGIKITKWFPRSELDTLREHLYHKRTQ